VDIPLSPLRNERDTRRSVEGLIREGGAGRFSRNVIAALVGAARVLVAPNELTTRFTRDLGR